MHKLIRITALFSSFTLAYSAFAATDYVMMKYNGEDLKLSEAMETWKTLFPGGAAPDFKSFDENIRQNVLRGIVSERLLYQEAVKAGYEKNPDVQKRIEDMKKQIVLQSYMENKADTLVTEANLKKAYDEKIKSKKDLEEVKARHILVKTEEEAKKIVGDLKKNGDFEKIAKEQSADKGSGASGGDLGWFTRDKMVKEFADAAFALKKGEISAPVKSNFGWHVIKLEDRRKAEPASFEESKEELRGALAEKAIQDYVTSVLKAANIKYFDENGKELPFDAAAKAVPVNAASDDGHEH